MAFSIQFTTEECIKRKREERSRMKHIQAGLHSRIPIHTLREQFIRLILNLVFQIIEISYMIYPLSILYLVFIPLFYAVLMRLVSLCQSQPRQSCFTHSSRTRWYPISEGISRDFRYPPFCLPLSLQCVNMCSSHSLCVHTNSLFPSLFHPSSASPPSLTSISLSASVCPSLSLAVHFVVFL